MAQRCATLIEQADDPDEREYYARLRDAWATLAKRCEFFSLPDVTDSETGLYRRVLSQRKDPDDRGRLSGSLFTGWGLCRGMAGRPPACRNDPGTRTAFRRRICIGRHGRTVAKKTQFIGGTLCALQFSGQGRTCGAAIWRCYSAYPSANGPTPTPTRLSGSCDAVSSRRERMIPFRPTAKGRLALWIKRLSGS